MNTLIYFTLGFLIFFTILFIGLSIIEKRVLKIKWYDIIPFFGLGIFIFEYLEQKR